MKATEFCIFLNYVMKNEKKLSSLRIFLKAYLRFQFSFSCQSRYRYPGRVSVLCFQCPPSVLEPCWLGVIELNRTFSNVTLMGPEFFFTINYVDTFVEELFL